MVSESSLEAYNMLKSIPDYLPECELRVLKAIYKKGCKISQSELSEALSIERCKITGRIDSLDKKGYICFAGRFKTEYSKVSLSHYELTEKGRLFFEPKQGLLF